MGCSSNSSQLSIKIGSKNFTENLILGEMYALALEDNGYKVERKLNLAGTLVAHEALKKGEIDLYPEYTGTGLINIMQEKPLSDAKEVYDKVAKFYKEQFHLVWLTPSNANNTQALAVSKKISDAYGIKTISDLQKNAANIRLAAVPEFEEREDGLLGLKRVYGDFPFKTMKLFDYGVKYRVVLNDEADLTVAFATDGELTNPELVVLQDDKKLWPPYYLAPVIRQEILDKDPNVRQVLDEISSKINDQTMQQLNAEVDIKKREYAEVAKEFLEKQMLLKKVK
ncbi:glycine/betaine ABC transporter substrate-binding protein [Paenibacillus albiflavus]|uniref:Glycine/betaine ABC transporter substrate-binding protein n=2 Tax=Paenibacillus albiflavus TaxID=2545760 RepID=A0A4R4E2C2_9BACL|nr:glycine/betaine ABC transporter substrate-binding protein [Paenibacillus albiflavus]